MKHTSLFLYQSFNFVYWGGKKNNINRVKITEKFYCFREIDDSDHKCHKNTHILQFTHHFVKLRLDFPWFFELVISISNNKHTSTQANRRLCGTQFDKYSISTVTQSILSPVFHCTTLSASVIILFLHWRYELDFLKKKRTWICCQFKLRIRKFTQIKTGNLKIAIYTQSQCSLSQQAKIKIAYGRDSILMWTWL